MPFRALLDGKAISSLSYEDTEWRALVDQTRETPSLLTLRCCGVNAIPCTSPKGRYFFRHHHQPKTCDWRPESDEHLDLKDRIASAIAAAGWSAEIEAMGPNWKADVLATRGKARIAFEVQLSAQGHAETALREDRYLASDVLPWWIVNSRNDGKGFGSDRRFALIGDTAEERVTTVAADVTKFLRRVESHVEVARALKNVLTKNGFKPAVEGIGAIPSVFRIEVHEGEQPIAIGEIGSGAIRDFERLKEQAKEAPWGALAQFVKTSPQMRGFGATAFYLKGKDSEAEIGGIVDKLLAGTMRWIDRDEKEHIEASYIWYEDICSKCLKDILRVPFFVHAHHKYWPKRAPSAFASHTLETASYERTIGRLAKRLGRSVGEIIKETLPFGQAPPADAPLSQVCPHCAFVSSDTLISADDALAWPNPEVDFNISIRVQAHGWLETKAPKPRPLPPKAAWDALLSAARDRRANERAEEERIRLKREADTKAEMEKWRQERERRKAEAAAAEERRVQLAAENKRIAEEERKARLADERAARLADAQKRLVAIALRKCRDRQKVDLWLKNYDPKLRGRPYELCGDFFALCEKRLAEIRF